VVDQPRSLSSNLRRIRYSIASTGWRRGLADVVTWLLTYRPDRDRTFDRRFGTDTSGSVATANLGIVDDATRSQAILYLPSPESVTRWMLKTLRVDYATYSFMDLGCGKGRVLLVASTYPFQRVIGVEISPELSQIARENAARFPARLRKADVEVQTIDAATVSFPKTNLLIHMYHPFGSDLTRVVLQRLEESVRETPRQVMVAYLLYDDAIEAVDEVFAGFPWLTRRRYERSVLGHYNWLFYSN
jgi:SAM-dependent methyltransferase